MKERLRRSVVVDAPLDVAWNYLSKPEEWPQSWAGHLKRVECNPPGAVTEKTQGVLQMKEGFKSRLTMVEFHRGQNWKWIGRGRIGPRLAFDHQFEAVGEHRTKIDFVVETGGFLEALFGRLNTLFLGRRLDQNLPRLVADLNDIGKVHHL
jgi:carbon monoxide dehydrogenase subunit G